ncbi:MAG: class II fructose-bisphosphate aldolase [Actinobacteria bacterium]|nr:class II fructose-bisphosphate aldolase [Actinomycetota bacterium]
MALISLKDLLKHARQNKYAVGAFNVTNLGLIDTFIDAAVEQRSPIIMQIAEAHLRYVDLEHIAPIIINAAKNVDVPICFHLDHGKSFETVIRAIRAGFTSVMFDGSQLPLEENIAKTKEIKKIADAINVSVEGEIGYVGGEAIGEAAPVSHAASKETFTKVEEIVKFDAETKIDALAVAIGNVHGFYKGKPDLDFERLAAIRDAVDVPLVLHGGSGISDEDFKKAISLGVCKINFYTAVSAGAVSRIREYLKEKPEVTSIPDVIAKGFEEAKNIIKNRMEVFGSKNMCSPDKTLCLSCTDKTCGFADPKLSPGTKTVIYDDLIEKISREVIANIKNRNI